MTGGGFDPEAYRAAYQQGIAIAICVLLDDAEAAAAAAEGDHLAVSAAGSIVTLLRRTNEAHYPEDWSKVRDLMVADLRLTALAEAQRVTPPPPSPGATT